MSVGAVSPVSAIPIKPNEVRDWFLSYAESATKTVEVYKSYSVCGLDIFVHNRGASSLTVSIDDQTAITIAAGDSFSMNNVKFAKIKVTSSVNYDMILAGIAIKRGR